MVTMTSELVDAIAQAIRVADGSHTMGAGELAEHIADLFTDSGLKLSGAPLYCLTEALGPE